MRVAEAEVRVVSKGTKQAQAGIKGIIKQIGLMVGGIYAARKAFDFLKESIQSAMEYQENIAKINRILQTTGMEAGVTSEQILNLANQIQYTTGVSKNMVLQAEGIMLTFTQVSNETFPRAIKAANDMSVMFGQDLQQSVVQLGTALNDPIRGVGRLRRIGISFTEDQKDMIKGFMEQNDVMSAQNVILDELNREFGGAAEAIGQTLPGKMKILKASFDDIKRGIGEGIISSGLFVNAVDAMAGNAIRNGESVDRSVSGMVRGFINNAVLWVNTGIGTIVQVVGAIVDGVNVMLSNVVEFFAKTNSTLISIAIDVIEKYNEVADVVPGLMQISTEYLDDMGHSMEAWAKKAEEGLFTVGEEMYNFGNQYILTAEDIYHESDNMGTAFDQMGGSGSNAVENLLDEMNNLGGASQSTADDVEEVTSAIMKLEKRAGSRLAATIDGLGESLGQMNRIINEDILEIIEAQVKDNVVATVNRASEIIQFPKDNGSDMDWGEMGQDIAGSIFNGLHGAFTENAFDWGKALAKILFEIAMAMVERMIPGGQIIGGIVRGIGGMFGLSVPGGQPIIVQNVNAMDARSFVDYMNSYPVQSQQYAAVM